MIVILFALACNRTSDTAGYDTSVYDVGNCNAQVAYDTSQLAAKGSSCEWSASWNEQAALDSCEGDQSCFTCMESNARDGFCSVCAC